MATKQHLDRLYKDSVVYAMDRAGGPRAFWIIGATFRKALVAQAILQVLYTQDSDEVADAAVRNLLDALYERLSDDKSLED